MTTWLDPMPPLSPSAWLTSPPDRLPYPLEEPGFLQFKLSRHALWHGLSAVGLEPGDAVLVPAYHHGSEIEALERHGLECRFYAPDERLEPDPDELETLLDERIRALALVHYLGFPQDSPRWRGWCDKRGLLLFEDAAQAWLSERDGRPVGSFGALAIFSLYKTVALPLGAALACSALGRAEPRPASGGLGELADRHLAWLGQRLPAQRLHHAPAAPGEYDPAEDFALGDPHDAPPAALPFLLPRLAQPDIAARRRAAYGVLLERLGERVPPPFDELPEGACPFVFPVETDDKRGLLDRLARHGVGALDLWSVPHPSLPAQRFPAAARRRQRVVGLPVHQGLLPEHLDRVAAAAGTGARRPAELRLDRHESLDQLEEEWRSLAERCGNPFSTWEFARTWWRHFGHRQQLAVTSCRAANGRLAAILPLCRSRFRSLPALRMIGHGPADQLGPVCAPADRALAASALRHVAREEGALGTLLVAEGLPADEGWGALLGGMVLERSPSPVLRVDGRSWDGFLADRSHNFRQQVRSRERKLAKRHRVRFRLADAGSLERDVETLFELHDARWAGGGSDAFAGARRAFHRDLAAVLLERGWLRLWVLELDGHAAATWYGFRYGGAEWYYQSGRRPEFESEAVGFVLLCHTIREAVTDGMREYRMLLGGESYKDRFANRDPGLETVAVPAGPIGRAAVAAVATRRALRSLQGA